MLFVKNFLCTAVFILLYSRFLLLTVKRLKEFFITIQSRSRFAQISQFPLLFTFHILCIRFTPMILHLKNSIIIQYCFNSVSLPRGNLSLSLLTFYVMNLHKFYIFGLIRHTIKLFVTKFQYWIIRYYRRYVFIAAISETSDYVLLLKGIFIF